MNGSTRQTASESRQIGHAIWQFQNRTLVTLSGLITRLRDRPGQLLELGLPRLRLQPFFVIDAQGLARHSAIASCQVFRLLLT
jgi:hypothetical protein